MSLDEEKVRATFCDQDQGHVFRFWDDLSPDDRQVLLTQLSSIELDRIRRLVEIHLADRAPPETPSLQPAETFRIPVTEAEIDQARRWSVRGEEVLRSGEVAVLVAAGGQATRLGFEGPKGTYPITPVTRKSLFQLHVEKVLALRQRYEVAIPLIVLVAPHNRAATQDFFARSQRFGLPAEDLIFVEQGVLPAVDRDGHLLLADKGRIFLSPDGHGGVYRALARSDVYEDLRARGVRSLFYFQVDNPMVRVGDPGFVGMHREQGSEFSLKVVRKRDADEKVGVFARIDGRPGVMEYSDISRDLREQREAEGLRFWAGSIGIHLLEIDFMERIAGLEEELPFHMARKTVPTIGEDGERESPSEANGLKFENFVFDALTRAERCAALEVHRHEEFSPVKNREGEDSPAVAIRAQSALYRIWLKEAGVTFADADDAEEDSQVEIGPLFAFDREELCRKIGSQGIGKAHRVLLD